MSCSKNYSIIIPHKNCINLLKRCLDSIPVRDDVEVVVVDDNSDLSPEQLRFFPGICRPQTQVFFTTEGRGAGYARNIGLTHAKGRYLLFADADDFFSEELVSVLDEAIGFDEDIIFLKHRSVLSDDISVPMSRCNEMNSFVDDYLSDQRNADAEMRLRCSWSVPWAKLIKKDLIDKFGIRFSEVKYANDIFFSIQAGIMAKNIRAVGKEAYIVTVRENSLSSNFCGTSEEFVVRLEEALKTDRYLKKAKVDNEGRSEANELLWHVYYTRGERYMSHCCVSSVFRPKVFAPLSLFLLKRRIKRLKCK